MRRLETSNAKLRTSRGFTLIEAMIVTVIVGVGVVGTLQLLAVGTQSNVSGAEVAIGVNLAAQVREMSLGMKFYDAQSPGSWNTKEASLALYDNVLDLDGCVFTPPVDARRQTLSNYATWTQNVSVDTVQLDNLATTRPDTVTEPSARVTVRVQHNGRDVYTTSWIAVSSN